jgi:hypothetical protein
MQSKANSEIQQKEFNREQTLKEIQFAVDTGSKLAQGAVAMSKQKQIRDFANALAATKMTPGTPGSPARPGTPVFGGGTIPTVEATPNADGTVSPGSEVSAQPTPSTMMPMVGGPSYDGAGLASIGGAEAVPATPPKDTPESLAIRAGAIADPANFAKNYAEQQFPDTLKLALTGSLANGVPDRYINLDTGERTTGIADKLGNLHLATGQTFPVGAVHRWVKDPAAAIMAGPTGLPTAYDKLGPNRPGSSPTAGPTLADKGIPALQIAAPKLADRFVKARDDAFPENNNALKTQVEASASAAVVESILKNPEVNQVGLQSLGFHLARMSGSNSQLSDAERATFERGLSLARRIKDQGYKLGAGDLSPDMRRELLSLSQTLENRAKAQGQRYILSAKRNAKGQVGDRLYKQLELDKEFPDINDLVANASEMMPSSGSDLGDGFSYTVN